MYWHGKKTSTTPEKTTDPGILTLIHLKSLATLSPPTSTLVHQLLPPRFGLHHHTTGKATNWANSPAPRRMNRKLHNKTWHRNGSFSKLWARIFFELADGLRSLPSMIVDCALRLIDAIEIEWRTMVVNWRDKFQRLECFVGWFSDDFS